jgi:hypothetical protein
MKTCLRFSLFAACLSLAALVFAQDDAAKKPAIAVDRAGLSAAHLDAALKITIPVVRPAATNEDAAIGVEVYNFDGVKLAAPSAFQVKLTKARHDFIVTVPVKIAPADLMKTYVRIVVKTAAGEATPLISANLFEILQRLEVQAFAQNEYLRGSRAGLRIVTLDQRTREPIPAKVTVTLKHAIGNPPKPLEAEMFKGETRKDGTAQIEFKMPEVISAQATLVIRATSEFGSVTLEQSITLKSPAKILLTSDKPLYQPGQMMHLRALCLRADNQQPLGDTNATIEVLDAKGNKVFKKEEKTDKFGIISCNFSLASECLMGDYKIRAVLADADNPNAAPVTAEKDVTVKRYVLPKFKIAFSTDKQFYRPGETVKGEIQADYFFGKPAARAEVQVKVSKFDVEWSPIEQLVGQADAKGHYSFELKLPDHFVGQPFEQGNARVRFDVTVRDEAEHTENVTQTRTVAKDAINIFAIPESGRLVPNLEQNVFVMTTYPDGSPAPKTRVTLVDQKQTHETDALGMAVFTIKPEVKAGAAAQPQQPQMMGRRGRPMPVQADFAQPEGGDGENAEPAGAPFPLKVSATDAKGNKAERTINLNTEAGADALLARLSQSLGKVGDKLTLDVFTTKKAGTVYVDVIKNRQTMATYSLEVKDSRGSMELPLTPDMTGSVQIHCYLLDAAGDTVRETKLLFVNAADDLRIETTVARQTPATDKSDTFKPGERAQLNFTVTDSKKNPVVTALGIVIVDEAVFALQEMQPGLEKVYFLLEQEIMKPRIQIQQQSLDDVIRPFPMPLPQPMPMPAPAGGDDALLRKQQAARVLLASAEMAYKHPVKVSSAVKGMDGYIETCLNKIKADYAAIEKGIREYERSFGGWQRAIRLPEMRQAMLEKKLVKESNFVDPWGAPYTINTQFQADRNRIERFQWMQFTWQDGSSYGGEWNFHLLPRFAASLGIDYNKLQQEQRWQELEKVNQMLAKAQPGGGFGGGRNMMMMRRGGGPEMMAMQMDMAMPMAAAAPPNAVPEGAVQKSGAAPAPGAAAEPRIRMHFPETLFFEPSLITDAKGKASVPLALADSITTWRLSAMGNAQNGMLGSTQAPIRVFQDFFVDIDLPVTLTQGDQVSIPVAIYNYLKEPQSVRLELEREPWFGTPNDPFIPDLPPNAVRKTKQLEANSVGVVYFTITVKELGWHKLTIKAFGSKMSDAVRREIEVVPNGQEQTFVINDSLDANVEKTVAIPENAIAGASKILVKIYPGIFSQMLEGLDGLLQMPSGCFEQTSSTLYPNILVLDYLKQTRQAKPDIQMRAEGFINHGYQRLLTFEVQGGGFEWFGQAPANQILTAWGVMQFKDMARVYPSVDPAIITRTQNWLVSKQNANGTWTPDKAYLHAESWGNIQGSDLMVTAYVTWALIESGYKGPAVDKAVEVLKHRADEAKDPYMLALVAQALVAWNKEAKETLAVLDRARDIAVPQEKEAICWQPKIATACYGHGDSAAIETTAMFAQAFTKAGRYPDVVTKALAYLTRKKDARGAWGSTQATIQALKAFNLALAQAGKETDATVTVLVNGKETQKLKITPKDADVLRLVDCGAQTKTGENKVELKFEGKGAMLYQVVGRYWMPWDAQQPMLDGRPMPLPAPIDGEKAAFAVQVQYDKTELETENLVTAKVTVTNNSFRSANMVVVDLGVPPGFQVQTEDLDKLVAKKVITRYDMTGRQIILYFEKLKGAETTEFSYQLKAKFPVVVQTPRSRAYSYYNPEQQGIAKPQKLTVTAK